MSLKTGKLLRITLLAICLAAAAAPASADPVGYLVNKIMEQIINNANKPKIPEHTLPKPHRGIPEESKLGELEPTVKGRNIVIDGDPYLLAFSARIRDENNRIVQTGSIRQEKRIRYTLNQQKEVDKIWLLTPREK